MIEREKDKERGRGRMTGREIEGQRECKKKGWRSVGGGRSTSLVKYVNQMSEDVDNATTV